MAQNNAKSISSKLGDFTVTPRTIPIALLAVLIGVVAAYVALGLLKLIGWFTNVLFFGRWTSTALVSPAGNHLGWWEILVPVGGAIVIGFMARYGSERIRGHGIPEALESILINGSRVEPRLAILKPLSAAISIGSGGPFGAEGPIIVTGGAFGSMIAQFFRLTSAERKTLLVAGAAAGMSATFASPLAAIALAVEVLLFEWKPRSLVPVALASATAGAVRRYLIGLGPLFPAPQHSVFIGPEGLAGCVLCGVLAGGLAALLTLAVYASEDVFRNHIHVHWMWWPAIGGLAVGLGGIVFPQALGVGYDTIGALLQGTVPYHIIWGILLVKSFIWAFSLGSGTSGGVLAPLLMMGGALGGLEAMVLPNEGAGFWPLISMGATLGGTMRAPFTGIIFALELTHDLNAVLPLVVATVIAHFFTTLTLKRSILTEKVARRGYHLSAEYAVDPLEVLLVRDVMRTNIAVLSPDLSRKDLPKSLHASRKGQRLYPVLSPDRHLDGVVTREDLQKLVREPGAASLSDVIGEVKAVAYPDEPLRAVVNRMADTGLTRFPVVESEESQRLAGIISLEDLLCARVRHQEEEQRRERVLRIHLPFAANRQTSEVSGGSDGKGSSAAG
jgi:chloride channel protein, CIC family